MKTHLHNLFVPHHGNNHKSKLLHNHSLAKLVMIVFFFQLILTGVNQAKPGILGYASNITVGDIVAQTNAQRQANGLGALSFNGALSDSAGRKASHMFANNYWAHNAPDGTSPWTFFQQSGYSYLYAGENLARDFNDSGAVTQAWMSSQTHKDNILSGRYTEIGVAVVNGVLDGQETTLVVQHFGRPAAAAPQVEEQAALAPAPIPAETKEIIAGEQAETIEELAAEIIPETEPVAEPLETFVQEVEEVQKEESKPTAGPPPNIENLQVVTTPGTEIPKLSSFDLTKGVNLALIAVVLVALLIDAILIWQRKTIRRSGKSFIHLVFLALIGLIILFTSSGNII